MSNALTRIESFHPRTSPSTVERVVLRPEIRVPRALGSALTGIYIAESPPRDLDLVIRTKDRDLKVQQMVAYLAFSDRVFGRLVFGSLGQYRRARKEYLSVAEVQKGSLLFVLRDAASSLLSAQGIILTGLALKYLPACIRSPAAAYRDFEQGRLFRAQRKQLGDGVASDPKLEALSKKDTSQLLSVLARIYEREQHHLGSAQSFAIRSVIEVTVERRKK